MENEKRMAALLLSFETALNSIEPSPEIEVVKEMIPYMVKKAYHSVSTSEYVLKEMTQKIKDIFDEATNEY